MARQKRKNSKNKDNIFKNFFIVLKNMIIPKGKGIEVTGILLMGLGILIFLDLVFNTNVIHLKNSSVEYTGILGYQIAYYLFLGFGWIAFIIPVILCYIGYFIFVHQVIEKKIIKISGIILITISVCSLLSLIFGEINFLHNKLEGVAGGVLGATLALIVVKYFGKVLGYSILVLLSIISVTMLTPISFKELWIFILKTLTTTGNNIYRVISRMMLYIKEFVLNMIRSFNEKNLKKIKEREAAKKDNNYTDEKPGIEETKPAPEKTEPSQEKIIDKPKPEPQIRGVEKNTDKGFLNTIKKTISKEKPKKEEVKKDIPVKDTEEYILPSTDILDFPPPEIQGDSKDEILSRSKQLENTLKEYGVECRVIAVNKGPTVTQFEVQVATGTKLSQLAARSDEIAYTMAASSVRIEAPIPGKTAIGVEIPNKNKNLVVIRELMEKSEFRENNSKLLFILGKSINGDAIFADLEKMPHILIAGSTGSGKSICIHSIINSILFRARPDEVRLLLIDPKMVELQSYNGIPHLVHPVVTDPRKAAKALKWAVKEMENRYKLFAEVVARDIKSYNNMEKPETLKRPDGTEINVPEKLPFIMIVVDELADLMMVSAKECEEAVMRLAQMARAVGIHLVLATQRPSVDVVTGVLKANLPYRIAFSVLSKIDSRTILDTVGAETLLGKGDMLYLAGDKPKPIRVQGTLISPKEIKKTVTFITDQGFEPIVEDIFAAKIADPNNPLGSDDYDEDELYDDAFKICIQAGYASTSLVQRRLRIGYNRAARLIDTMEARGLISPPDGSRPRKILVQPNEEE